MLTFLLRTCKIMTIVNNYYEGIKMTTGDKIKKLRIEKGLTQAELGVVLTVVPSAISKYESNLVPVPNEHILTLADFFGVSTDYLLR